MVNNNNNNNSGRDILESMLQWTVHETQQKGCIFRKFRGQRVNTKCEKSVSVANSVCVERDITELCGQHRAQAGHHTTHRARSTVCHAYRVISNLSRYDLVQFAPQNTQRR